MSTASEKPASPAKRALRKPAATIQAATAAPVSKAVPPSGPVAAAPPVEKPAAKAVAAKPAAPKAAAPARALEPPAVSEPVAAKAPVPAEIAEAPAARPAAPVPEIAVADAPATEQLATPVSAVALPATSPVPVAAPVEIVEPAAAAPAVPSEPKTASKPSQPLTFMVSHMTATPTFKGYEEIAAFGKANIDAFIQANSVFTKGVEAISKEVIALTQAQLESNAAAAKAIFAAKTLKDMVELNAEFTKSSFDKMVANSTKLGELGTKIATDTFAPLSARVTSVVEKAAKPTA
jgi:phasin family protein